MTIAKTRVALVTGGSRGIGAAVCKELASDGVYVYIGWNSSEQAAGELKASIEQEGGQAAMIQLNVSDESSIEAAVQELVGLKVSLDCLACCAGTEDFTPLGEITQKKFDNVFHTNTFGQFKCVSAFHKLMSDGGRIALTSSVSTRMSVREHMLYAASKSAVECFVKNVALELGDKGIGINAISPGGVMTDMAKGNAAKYIPKNFNVELSEWKKINSAAKRIGNTTEIAKAYAFLLSNNTPFMTGSVMSVDGGRI